MFALMHLLQAPAPCRASIGKPFAEAFASLLVTNFNLALGDHIENAAGHQDCWCSRTTQQTTLAIPTATLEHPQLTIGHRGL
jgi:hypothetical protein